MFFFPIWDIRENNLIFFFEHKTTWYLFCPRLQISHHENTLQKYLPPNPGSHKIYTQTTNRALSLSLSLIPWRSKMHSSTLLPYNPTTLSVSSITSARNPLLKPPLRFCTLITTRKARNNSYLMTCKASSSSTSSSMMGLDLYDLLGVDSSSDQTQIKLAYRALQKRCHPDIAGPAGHEMAIILNEAYSLLSDPSSRSVYDRVSTHPRILQSHHS